MWTWTQTPSDTPAACHWAVQRRLRAPYPTVGGDLPTQDFLGQVVPVVQNDLYPRVAGPLQGLEFSVGPGFFSARHFQMDEHAVRAVSFGAGQILAVHGQDALAVFTRALG